LASTGATSQVSDLLACASAPSVQKVAVDGELLLPIVSVNPSRSSESARTPRPRIQV